MLAPVLVTPPGATPISTVGGKAHSRIAADLTDEDALVDAYVEAATQNLDGWSGILGRCLVTQTWRQDFAAFADKLGLPLAPVSSVSSVTYYDAANVSQTLASSVYELMTDGAGPFVHLKPDQVWPDTYSRLDAVSITFVAGYGSAGSDVPQPIRQAIRLLAAHWNENREAAGVVAFHELPIGVRYLLTPYRRIGF